MKTIFNNRQTKKSFFTKGFRVMGIIMSIGAFFLLFIGVGQAATPVPPPPNPQGPTHSTPKKVVRQPPRPLTPPSPLIAPLLPGPPAVVSPPPGSPPHPGWIWVPGHYKWVPGHWARPKRVRPRYAPPPPGPPPPPPDRRR